MSAPSAVVSYDCDLNESRCYEVAGPQQGEFGILQNCQLACVNTTTYSCNYDGKCAIVPGPEGTYATLKDCQSVCVPADPGTSSRM